MLNENILRDSLLTKDYQAREELICQKLKAFFAEFLQKDETDIDCDIEFSGLCPQCGSLMLLSEVLGPWIKQHLGLRYFYPIEMVKNGTIRLLSAYLAREIDPPPVPVSGLESISDHQFPEIKPYTGNEPIVEPTTFVLGAMRSGTTLLRLMLDGHPALYSPAELNLLQYNSMGERRAIINETEQHWIAFALYDVLAEFMDINPQEAWSFINDLEQRDVSVREVYALLHEYCGPRQLVDKAPLYSENINSLKRAEAMFVKPKYIFLTRHPYAVINSFVQSRFYRMFEVPGKKENPWLRAEKNWWLYNKNVIEFFKEIPDERKLQVKYEDLVTDVATNQSRLSDFLNIEFDEQMCSPYTGERILSGVGDPGLASRDKVDASLAEVWRNHRPPQNLDRVTKNIATNLGYDIDD